MPNTHLTLTDLFDDCADAIREKDGTSAAIVADTFPARIRAIPSGGGAYTIYPAASAPAQAQNGDVWIDYSGDISGMPDPILPGNTPVLLSSVKAFTISSTTVSSTGISITTPKAGTYRFSFSAARTSTSGTFTAQLYKNGTAVSGATIPWSSRQGTYTGDIACNAGDTVEIRARSGSTSNYTIVGQLVASIDWNIWGD